MQEFHQIRNAAVFFSTEAAEEEWQRFVETITNKDYALAPLPETAFLNFYADGKLVTLTDANKEGIIKLVDKKIKKKSFTWN